MIILKISVLCQTAFVKISMQSLNNAHFGASIQLNKINSIYYVKIC